MKPKIPNLNKLPMMTWALLNKALLCQLALLADGVQRAGSYARDCVEASWGLNLGRWMAGLDEAQTNIERMSKELDDILAQKENLPAFHGKGDGSSRVGMGLGMICIQILRGAIIVLLLLLGVHNCAMILVKSGEPFMTNNILAYITASALVPPLVFGLKNLIGLPESDKTRLKTAYMVTVSGIVCTLLFMAEFSGRFPPEYAGDSATGFDVEAEMNGGGDDGAVTEETMANLVGWLQSKGRGDLMTRLSLFLQLLGEAATGASTAYLFMRTLHHHRASRRHLSPEWRRLCKRENKVRKQLSKEQAKVGAFGGWISFLDAAQDVAEQQAVTFVAAQQRRNVDLGMS